MAAAGIFTNPSETQKTAEHLRGTEPTSTHYRCRIRGSRAASQCVPRLLRQCPEQKMDSKVCASTKTTHPHRTQQNQTPGKWKMAVVNKWFHTLHGLLINIQSSHFLREPHTLTHTHTPKFTVFLPSTEDTPEARSQACLRIMNQRSFHRHHACDEWVADACVSSWSSPENDQMLHFYSLAKYSAIF